MASPEPHDHPTASAEEQTVWGDFLRNRDAVSRAWLVSHHLTLARKHAAILFAKRPGNHLEFTDYMQWGVVGLLEAIDHYDPGHNTSFATFAAYRIRGSILNGVEKSSERTAQYGFKKRLRRERIEALTTDPDRSPPSDLFLEMVDAAIGLALGYMLEDSGMYHHGDEVAQEDPYRCLEIKRLRERFKLVVAALPERERLIVQYHYYQGMPFNTIADILNVTKGRVSQVHARALTLIRDAYQSLERFDVKF